MNLDIALKIVKDEIDKKDNGVLRTGDNWIFLADAVEALYKFCEMAEGDLENLKGEIDHADIVIRELESEIDRLRTNSQGPGWESVKELSQ